MRLLRGYLGLAFVSFFTNHAHLGVNNSSVWLETTVFLQHVYAGNNYCKIKMPFKRFLQLFKRAEMLNTALLFSVHCVDWAGFQIIEKYVDHEDLQCRVFLICTKVKLHRFYRKSI